MSQSSDSLNSKRRTFLKQSAVAASTALVPWSKLAAQSRSQSQAQSSSSVQADPQANLRPLAQIVLPVRSIGEDRLDRTLDRFTSWMDRFQPVAELDHAYLYTDEISYGPPDPRPLWMAQLEALNLEAMQRHQTAFSDLEAELQHQLVQSAIQRAAPARGRSGGADTDRAQSLPRPEHASHIGIALMAWYFRSSEANDLCYSKRIGRHECRGMNGVTLEPRPLPVRGPEASRDNR